MVYVIVIIAVIIFIKTTPFDVILSIKELRCALLVLTAIVLPNN